MIGYNIVWMQREAYDTGIILNPLRKKKFKRNGTFETRFALKAKQNEFHHKVAKNKFISYIGGSKKM